LLGFLMGQFQALAVWGVFGPQSLLARWSSAVVTGTVLLGTGPIAAAVLGNMPHDFPVLLLLYALPLLLLSAQLPLWGLRALTGWSIVTGGQTGSRSPSSGRQFAVKDLLAAAVIVAATLGTGQLAIRILVRQAAVTPGSAVGIVLAYSVAAFSYSLFCTVPCFCVIFADTGGGRGHTILTIVTATLVILLLSAAVLGVVAGGPELGGAIFLFHIALAFTVIRTFRVFRDTGFSLLRPGQRRLPAASAEPQPDECPDCGQPNADGGTP
jgi:hypothetical protein